MDRLESRIAFRLLVKLTNVKFSTPYYQLLAGQEVREIKKETITEKEYNQIKDKKILDNYRDVILVGRNLKGEELGRVYVDKDGKSCR